MHTHDRGWMLSASLFAALKAFLKAVQETVEVEQVAKKKVRLSVAVFFFFLQTIKTSLR